MLYIWTKSAADMAKALRTPKRVIEEWLDMDDVRPYQSIVMTCHVRQYFGNIETAETDEEWLRRHLS